MLERGVGEPLRVEERKRRKYAALVAVLDRSTLVPTSLDGRSVRLYTVEAHPDILLRERAIAAGEDARQILETFVEAQNLFEAMQAEYGIRVVAMDSAIRSTEGGKKVILTVVDRIEGENLFAAKRLPEEAKDELETLYLSLTAYYRNAWKDKSKFWGDCKSSQFVFGNMTGQKDKHVFMVDVDPTFYEPGESEFYTVEWCVNSLCSDLVEYEGKFEPQIRMQKARSSLSDLVRQMLETAPDSQPLLQAKKLFEDGV